MRKLLVIVILLHCKLLAAQDSAQVRYTMDDKVELLLERKLELDQSKPSIQGYRVQLYYGGNRSEALELKSKFSALFPDIDSYLIYQQPYFRLRAGNYRSRIEAHQLLKKVQRDFPSVFIVNDEIAWP